MTRLYFLESKYEFLKLMRIPAFALPSILFPAVFYLFFGVGMGSGRGVGGFAMATYLLATYGAFGVIGSSLFGLGVGVASERGQGWLQVKRATPMPIGAWFFAKIAMSLVFGAMILAVLFVLGLTAGNVSMPWTTWLTLAGALLLGSIPFCAFGLVIGYFAGPNSAPPIVNLIYLPMAFASGLWVPIEFLPGLVKSIAPWLPPYHLAQLALGVIGMGEQRPPTFHFLALAGFTVVFLVLAAVGYRRDEGKTYG